MFKKGKKQKSFSKEYELKGEREGGFILRITEKRVDIETKVKDWKIMFSAQTYEYGFIYHLLKNQDLKALHSIAVAWFVTRLVCRDVAMVPEIYACADRVQERMLAAAAAKPQEQTDEEILAEEKVIHEQTPESIMELEQLKSAQLAPDVADEAQKPQDNG